MDLFDNHKTLFGAAFLLFTGLTLVVAVFPSISSQENNAVLPGYEPLSDNAEKGRRLYIANGCVACHTQQVRNVDMDKVWGARPSIAADYAPIHRTDVWCNTATLMGTERTGPDLTNIGKRQPSQDWQLTHLYNPRMVVKASVMPAYPWLFHITKTVKKGDVVVKVPEGYLEAGENIIATKEALQLTAYLLSLQQVELPDGTPAPDFLYKRAAAVNTSGAAPALSGAALYTANCQSCHQENGEGLKGAFPPLKGSNVVNDEDASLMIDIIMNGYSGRIKEGYGPMPAVGTNNNLTPEEVMAIINHERSSWGNQAKTISLEEVKQVIDKVKK